jgi:hypothetical protein
MLFEGKLVRNERALPVRGEVHQVAGGRWEGTFSFSTDEAPTVAPGGAEIVTADGHTWRVHVTSTTTKPPAARGTSSFQVLAGLP